MELTYFYAQVNADGICFAVTSHGSPLPASPTLIPLDSYDESKLGQKFVDGKLSPA
ncbi:hypothetical protein [Roseateles asaccharophilus]|uniref:Uncharacterized protein n=1 Tax=Roseateles asaccharophilus TaxID=582607 RepID=A0ABU2A6W8_9BURK|nr:hypothetical protein [Roseateles asaccharophilus]MDR7331773.1 hypothetical protein [Roseateles asaccharophilus]